MNKTSRNKDESKIEFYGPLASGLSFILNSGNKALTDLPDTFIVYRGLKLTKEELEENFQINSKVQLTGFTSTTLERKTALGFAIGELTNIEARESDHLSVLFEIIYSGG